MHVRFICVIGEKYTMFNQGQYIQGVTVGFESISPVWSEHIASPQSKSWMYGHYIKEGFKVSPRGLMVSPLRK